MAEVINEELKKSGAAVNDMFAVEPLVLIDVLDIVEKRLSEVQPGTLFNLGAT